MAMPPEALARVALMERVVMEGSTKTHQPVKGAVEAVVEPTEVMRLEPLEARAAMAIVALRVDQVAR